MVKMVEMVTDSCTDGVAVVVGGGSVVRGGVYGCCMVEAEK